MSKAQEIKDMQDKIKFYLQEMHLFLPKAQFIYLLERLNLFTIYKKQVTITEANVPPNRSTNEA